MDSRGGQSQTANANPSAPHVLVIPAGQVGHSIPMLRVATHLASHGIIVSFVIYEDAISSLSKQIPSSEDRIQHNQNFQFLGVPRPSNPGSSYQEAEFQAESKLILEKLVQDKENGIPGGPTCMLVDMFVPWTQDVSNLLQVPRYVLITSGIVFGKHLLEYACIYDRGVFKIGKDGKLSAFEGYVSMPGLPSLSYEDMPVRSVNLANHSVNCSRALWTSTGVLFNSFLELEEEVIEAWRISGDSRPAHSKVPAIYPVGPLLPTPLPTRYVPASHGLDDSAEIVFQWLESQAPSSVLYVAFGSKVRLSPEQIRELALGLEASEQHFLWVLPTKKVSSNVPSVQDDLPEGFRERVCDRACIVNGWVPQMQILGHSSMAAFLTHCGWNSVLEAILEGLPMIAWPQISEQRLNSRYLVDTLKIALEMPTASPNLAKRDHVKDVVRHLLVEPDGQKIKTRVKELQKKSSIAMSESGSQSMYLRKLVQDIQHGFANK